MVDIFLLNDTSKLDENKLLQYSQSVSKTIKSITKCCIEKLTPDLIETREVLENLVGVVEIFAIITILCGNWKSSMNRERKNLKKGKKKKEDEENNDFVICKSVLKDLSECMLELDEALSSVNELISEKIVAIEVINFFVAFQPYF